MEYTIEQFMEDAYKVLQQDMKREAIAWNAKRKKFFEDEAREAIQANEKEQDFFT